MSEALANDVVEAAIELAGRLLERSAALQTPQERRQQAELDRMIASPGDKATMVEMTDQAFRTGSPARVADQLTHILDLQGVPRFFSPLDRTLLRGFQSFGNYLPGVVVPMVKDKMRRETANVILPAEEDLLVEHLRARSREGIAMNVNFLGEAILGEREAAHRMETYLAALRHPAISCISVKISTIYSQITSIAHRHSVAVLCDRLESLYRAAVENHYRRPDGSTVTKFVYLDMEEYRDMRITAEVLMRTLDRPGMEQVRAGIALQAYLPDSYPTLQQLITWAGERTRRGGLPLTVRVVKGANLEMERVEASISGFPQAPYTTKVETDANYKRMLRRLLVPDVAQSIRVGVASHNLFDIALAYLWAQRAGVLAAVQFEMLEGMANHQRRALSELSPEMLLYAPACRREDFLHAVGYLIRRLDENTGPANFLRHTYRLQRGSEDWNNLAADFRRAYALMETVSSSPRRTQDRTAPPPQPAAAAHWRDYVNEPDTDWALPQNVRWAEQLVERWQNRCGDAATVIAPAAEQAAELTGQSFDPSRPGVVVGRFHPANEADVQRAVATALAAASSWRELSFDERHARLRAAAQWMRVRRGDLIGAAVAEGGKTVTEADPEVSEAIDFTEFYPLSVKRFFDPQDAASDGVAPRGRGVVVVVSPWNFPIAIPCGGIAAALAAGNTVILKPSLDTPLVAWMICQCFWDAGVPADALQFLPCATTEIAQQLVSHDDVDAVVLTGGTETARAILRSKREIELIAETGGKNTTIVTALADRDQAIKHVVHSAFGHAGQKCSATSLLLLQRELYDDERFRQTLADAVQSLRVGSAWELSNRVGPLIRPPRGPLQRSLETLEPGESWLVKPQLLANNPQLYSPGVKWGVSPHSFTHLNELFGPVLGVIPFDQLDEAIEIANATNYGLTSGLQTLDDREQQRWREAIRAGNLYINRGTTGAIVLRQPFGGMGQSSYGPGLKAGGPNYVVPLMEFAEQPTAASDDAGQLEQPDLTELPEPLEELLRAAGDLVRDGLLEASGWSRLSRGVASIAAAAAAEFNREHDNVRLLGQDNLRSYLAVPHLRVRLAADDDPVDLLITAAAAVAVDCRAVFSHRDGECERLLEILDAATAAWAGRIETIEESDEELATAIHSGGVDRVRLLSRRAEPAVINRACIERFVPCIRQPVVASGWVEPLWYLQEQSLSFDYHRYGNLGRRADEPRRPLPT